MRCRDYACKKGVLDLQNPAVVSTHCGTVALFPCTVCKRLHWADGSPAKNRNNGNRAFFKNGKAIEIDRNGKEHAL
jgi:hypothetical protein